MKPLIEINEKKCKFCYACVRICPVKAIRVDPESESPKFIADRCIGCGLCLTSCSPGAITYRNTKDEANRLLQSGEDVIAIVGPSISGEFNDITDYRKFVRMIKTLGFKHVNEISFGVDKVAAEYVKLFTNSRGKYYVTANCPVIVKYIEKYHPGLVSNIAPIVSPMAATAKILRKKYGNTVKFVYIGPCIEAKNEAERYKDESKVDVVITFRELREMFVEHGIAESSLEYSDFDQPVGHRGSLYPISEGFVEIMGVEKDILNNKIISADGKDDSHEAIAEFAENIDSINNHFNLFHCNGCLMGPGTSPDGKQFVRRSLVTDYSARRLKRFDKETWEAEFKKVEDLDLTATFVNDDQRVPVPSEKKINEILISMGKDPKDDELGCEACGYSSCRDLAIAVANGLSTPEICNTYAMRNKQRYIQSLKMTNEKLAKTQEALKESEKVALSEKKSAREAYEMTESMLQKLRSGVIIMDKQLKVIHSNQSFINLLGDEAREINDVIPGLVGADVKTLLPYSVYNLFNYVLTHAENIPNKDVHYEDKLLNISIFTIKKNKIAGAILRDLYAPEVRRDEVITRVTEVIDNNLEMVQKIGFLLGEGAAETERMLNSIIESFKKGKHDK